jgi:hypothetical protein
MGMLQSTFEMLTKQQTGLRIWVLRHSCHTRPIFGTCFFPDPTSFGSNWIISFCHAVQLHSVCRDRRKAQTRKSNLQRALAVPVFQDIDKLVEFFGSTTGGEGTDV